MPAEVHVIETNRFRLDGGSMFGVVPRVFWEKSDPPDDLNRIRMAARILLVKDGDRTLLIDTGLGNWHTEKFIKIYDVERPHIDLDQRLAPYHLDTQAITDVIITHLHFDHAAGLATQTEKGFAPTFPNARIWIQKQQYLWAQKPTPKDRASFLQPYIDILAESPHLHLIEGPQNIAPHISVIPIQGHTPAQQIVKIDTPAETILFTADLIPLASHVALPYIMAYDLEPMTTLQEKQSILQQACDNHWRIIFQHDPARESAHITHQDNKFTLTD